MKLKVRSVLVRIFLLEADSWHFSLFTRDSDDVTSANVSEAFTMGVISFRN